ncbi:putative disease resistance protein RGA3 [Sesamum alatum]|uniref:Disease resistance protein RGA3 n=1 Tax=Sesamum alatum TaxID=300844 RepID=A0AAE1YC57_9LAMI|nr:putative disease resistance protein RGA3 [Sesamum alatum]
MKQYSSYCSIFPKDSVIDVEELIRMWMALGYLGSIGSTSNLELRGKEYFNNLRMHSFFQNVEEDGDRVHCKMHDIVHDFAQFLRNTKRHDQDGRVEAMTNASLVSQVEVYRSLFCREELSCELFHFARRVRILSLCERFARYSRRYGEIGSLKELDQLSRLTVLNISLRDREDIDEARKAKLMNKIHIKSLIIAFLDTIGRTEEEESLRNETLEALQPPPNLMSLTTFGYKGARLSS